MREWTCVAGAGAGTDTAAAVAAPTAIVALRDVAEASVAENVGADETVGALAGVGVVDVAPTSADFIAAEAAPVAAAAADFDMGAAELALDVDNSLPGAAAADAPPTAAKLPPPGR